MQRYSSRMGRFYIDGPMLVSIKCAGVDSVEFKRAMGLLSQVFVVEARHVGYMDRVEYIGISALFEELAEGERIPEYILEGQYIEEKDPDGVTTHVRYEAKAFKRTESCSFCGAPR